MELLKYNELGLQEMDAKELQEVEGGFVPIVIWGVAFTASQVAGGAGAMFLAGIGIGAAVASK